MPQADHSAAARIAAATLPRMPSRRLDSSATRVAEHAEVLHRRLVRQRQIARPAVRLDSWCGWWCRRHFQKNSLMSGTFEPPEMYSTLLS